MLTSKYTVSINADYFLLGTVLAGSFKEPSKGLLHGYSMRLNSLVAVECCANGALLAYLN